MSIIVDHRTFHRKNPVVLTKEYPDLSPGGEGTLKEYRAMPDPSSVIDRMQHNISEFTKQLGSLDIHLYDVSISGGGV